MKDVRFGAFALHDLPYVSPADVAAFWLSPLDDAVTRTDLAQSDAKKAPWGDVTDSAVTSTS